MDANIKEVEESSKTINEAMAIFEAIPKLTNATNASVENISAVSEQNTAGVRSASSSINQIDSAMQQISASAQDLAGNSGRLKELIGQFKIDRKTLELSIVDIAIKDHRDWVEKIAACLRGEIKIDDKELKDHHFCRLGKWYYTNGVRYFGENEEFKKLESPHEKIHSLGKQIIYLYNNGQQKDAERLFEEIQDISKEVIADLEDLKRLV